MRRWKKKKRQE